MTTTTKQLTITQATRQARAKVDVLMPGVMATVESRGSFDLEANVATMVTTITHPANHPNADSLMLALRSMPGYHWHIQDSSRISITRTR